MLLGEPDVSHAVEDPIDADPSLGASERTTGARMHTAAERDVRLGIGTVDAELVGALEPFGVAVGGAVEQHDRRARRDVDLADLRGAAGEAEVGLDRAFHPERLLDEVGDAVLVVTELVLELGVFGEVLQRGGEQAGRRLLAGREQERRGPYH